MNTNQRKEIHIGINLSANSPPCPGENARARAHRRMYTTYIDVIHCRALSAARRR